MSSGPATSGMFLSSHSDFQSPCISWVSLGLSRPYGSFQELQDINLLGSAPAVTESQQATEGARIVNDSSTSCLSAYSGSQSQSSTAYGPFTGLASQYGGGQSSFAPAFQSAVFSS